MKEWKREGRGADAYRIPRWPQATRAVIGAFQLLAGRFAQAMPADAKVTVLHYTAADHDRGGVMSVVRALAAADAFECVLGVNPGFRNCRTPSLGTIVLPGIDGEAIALRTFWRARAVARAAREWLEQDRGRVFHAHCRAGLLTALWLARWGERRVVASVHCYGRHRWFYRWAARRLRERILWLSPAMKRYYGADGGESWDQCVPPCIPSALVTQAKKPVGGTSSNVVRMGGAGSIVPWKGWHLMIEALAAVPPLVRTRLHFAHIGSSDGSAESERYAVTLRRQTVALGLVGNVEWRGEQLSSRALLEECDCAVVLSQQEPFSMVMLEALAAGVPVLASAAGGPSDVLQPGANGWFFDPGNSASLAQKLIMLVETDARQHVRVDPQQLRRFTAPVVAEQWARVYARLCS